MRLNYHQFYWSTKLHIPYITQRGPAPRAQTDFSAGILITRINQSQSTSGPVLCYAVGSSRTASNGSRFWRPACHPSEYRKDGGVVSRTRLGNHVGRFKLEDGRWAAQNGRSRRRFWPSICHAFRHSLVHLCPRTAKHRSSTHPNLICPQCSIPLWPILTSHTPRCGL